MRITDIDTALLLPALARTRVAALCLGACIALTAACEGDGAAGDGPGGGEGEGEGEGDAPEQLELIEKITHPVEAINSVGFPLALRSDGRFAFAWAATGPGETTCQLFGPGNEDLGPATVDNYNVMVSDELADGTIRDRVVATVPTMADDGIDIAVDPASDALIVAFNGGAPARGVCGASDLVVAVEAGDTFTTSTVAADSADGSGPCRDPNDPFCASGDFVGRFPSLAVSPTRFALSYADMHFGFGETDLFGADLEICSGTGTGCGTITSASVEAGGGYDSSSTLTSDDRVVVAHAIIGSNTFPDLVNGGTYIVENGIYVSAERADGTYSETVVFENAEVAGRIGVAARDTEGILVVFREEDAGQLALFRSVDGGESFALDTPVEQIQRTGLNPQIGFLSDGTLVLAYGHCRDVNDNSDFCSTAQDGVRITWRSPGATTFNKRTFTGDSEDNDGLAVDMAITSDDVITTLSLNPTQSEIAIHRVRRLQ